MDAKEWYELFMAKTTGIMKAKRIDEFMLANKMGASEDTVKRWLDGKRIPSGPAIVRIAKALDVEVKELIDFED